MLGYMGAIVRGQFGLAGCWVCWKTILFNMVWKHALINSQWQNISLCTSVFHFEHRTEMVNISQFYFDFSKASFLTKLTLDLSLWMVSKTTYQSNLSQRVCSTTCICFDLPCPLVFWFQVAIKAMVSFSHPVFVYFCTPAPNDSPGYISYN